MSIDRGEIPPLERRSCTWSGASFPSLPRGFGIQFKKLRRRKWSTHYELGLQRPLSGYWTSQKGGQLGDLNIGKRSQGSVRKPAFRGGGEGLYVPRKSTKPFRRLGGGVNEGEMLVDRLEKY